MKSTDAMINTTSHCSCPALWLMQTSVELATAIRSKFHLDDGASRGEILRLTGLGRGEAVLRRFACNDTVLSGALPGCSSLLAVMQVPSTIFDWRRKEPLIQSVAIYIEPRSPFRPD